MVLEKILESPLDSKEIKPVNPKGSQPWILTGRTDAEGEASACWPPGVKSWFTRKGPDAGRTEGKKEKWVAEDEMDTNSMDISLSKHWEIVEDSGGWHATVH